MTAISNLHLQRAAHALHRAGYLTQMTEHEVIVSDPVWIESGGHRFRSVQPAIVHNEREAFRFIHARS